MRTTCSFYPFTRYAIDKSIRLIFQQRIPKIKRFDQAFELFSREHDIRRYHPYFNSTILPRGGHVKYLETVSRLPDTHCHTLEEELSKTGFKSLDDMDYSLLEKFMMDSLKYNLKLDEETANINPTLS